MITGESVQLVVPDLPLPERFTSGFIGSYAIDGRVPVDASPMGDMVVGARRAVQGQEAAREAGRMLYDVLIQPILDAGLAASKPRWIIVPHRQLHPVPWMALIDASGNPWLTTTTLTVCPSASTWERLAARRREGHCALALGDPLLGYAGMPALPQSATEVEHLGQVWQRAGLPADVGIGARASVDALREAGHRCVGHPPGNARHVPETATGEDHQLLLSMSAGSNGRLPASTLRGFRPPPRMVHHLECLQRRAVPDRSR